MMFGSALWMFWLGCSSATIPASSNLEGTYRIAEFLDGRGCEPEDIGAFDTPFLRITRSSESLVVHACAEQDACEETARWTLEEDEQGAASSDLQASSLAGDCTLQREEAWLTDHPLGARLVTVSDVPSLEIAGADEGECIEAFERYDGPLICFSSQEFILERLSGL